MSVLRRGLVLLAVLVTALASALAARAEIVVKQDSSGRAITFDVLAAAVDVDWYAAILSSAAHGAEIANVTIRIVPAEEIAGRCGTDAAACFEQRRGVRTITIPAGKSNGLAAILLHEYGHHLDSSWAVDGVPELNGTPVWWAARGMAALLQSRSVAFDYSLGWERSIAEVFAEDYAFVHTGGFYSIPWLAPPDDALKTALLAELGGIAAAPPLVPPAPIVPVADPRPVVVSRSGTLAAGARRTIPFRLIGPGRRVTVTAAVSSLRRSRTGARIEVVCDNAIVQRMNVGRQVRTLDLAGLGPATCQASLLSTTRSRQHYSVQLRLALDA